MKHHIIVKFNSDAPKVETMLSGIKKTFEPVIEIDGITDIEIKPNIIARENRYDLMIIITMTEAALPVYDECDAHKKWKSEYGNFIEKKAIFDSEN